MRRSGIPIRLIIGIGFAIFAAIKYYSNSSFNPVTNEKQRISLSQQEEIELGRQSAPQMAYQHGGLHPDTEAQALIDKIGYDIVENSDANDLGYPFEFHVLADENTINAFALPGGQVFITAGLLKRFTTHDQVAGVLGHEIAHVVARHSAEQLAKQQLSQGLTGAAVVAAGDYNSSQMVQVIGNMINMKYGREDELESDDLGVRFMLQAGYNPEAMKEVMRILDEANQGPRPPEFQSTHPSPENRIEKINEAIRKYKQ